MPWLTDLDAALRNASVGFWESPGWRTRGHGPMGAVRGVLIHHTAGGGSNDWRTVQNGRPGLDGPLAQLVFERDGGVRIIAAGQAWHAGTGSHPAVGGGSNATLIGIEGVSRGVGNDWTAAQRREYPRVAAALCRHYRLPATAVLGHKEFATPRGRKIDPGDWDMNAFRADVARHLGTTPAAPAAPTRSAADALRAGGIVADPDDVLAAARAAGIEPALVGAMLAKESYGGRNVFGNDRVAYPSTGAYTADTVEVTRDAAQAYLRWRGPGPGAGSSGRQNGVGPGQLTWWELQDDAERRGGLHVPRINMTVAAEVLAGHLRAAGGDVAEAGARYNGGPKWRDGTEAKRRQAQEYGRDLAARTDTLRRALAGTSAPAPGGIESMAFSDTFTDWAGNRQTVESWMEHTDKRLFELHRALVESSIPSRVDGQRYAAGTFLAATHGDVNESGKALEARLDGLEAKLDRLLAALPSR